MKRGVFAAAGVVLSTLAAIAVAEVGLRLAGVSYPNFVMVDKQRGYAGRPHAQGRFRSEGDAWVAINSDGLRDGEHPLVKPPGTYRIAVLGDSFTAAIHVPVEQAYWAILERKLVGCPALDGATPEVINFGVDGYSTAMQLQTLRHQVWKYAPDFVLLAFWPGNDVFENERELNQIEYIPYFVLKNGRVELDDRYLSAPRYRSRLTRWGRARYWLLDVSRVYQVIDKTLLGLERRRAIYAARAKAEQALGSFPALGVTKMVYQENPHPIWERAWAVTEALLAQMHSEVSQRNAQFAVVTLSAAEQVHPDPARRRAIRTELEVSDLFYPDRRIAAVGRREGFPVLTLGEPFLAHAERTGAFLHGFENTQLGTGHWNEAGHALGGELLTKWMCDDVLAATLHN